MSAHPTLEGHWVNTDDGWLICAAKPAEATIVRGSRVKVLVTRKSGDRSYQNGTVISRPFGRRPGYFQGRYDHHAQTVARSYWEEGYGEPDEWEEDLIRMVLILPDSRNPDQQNPYTHPDYIRLRDQVRETEPPCEIRFDGCQQTATVVDHIVPVSRNGTSDRRNLQPACEFCNNSKGARLLPRDQW